ncbi:unnamed protein product [Effrenium voratum]|nr:unnamed protein product [Effrenium voratum]
MLHAGTAHVVAGHGCLAFAAARSTGSTSWGVSPTEVSPEVWLAALPSGRADTPLSKTPYAMMVLHNVLFCIFTAASFACARSAEVTCARPSVAASLLQTKHNDTKVTKLDTEPEPEEFGGVVSSELGTDLLGDALEPTANGHGALPGDAAHAEVHADGYVVLLMFFGCLLLGACLMLSLERLAPAVPYTVAMFLCGVVFACWHFSRTPESRVSWHTWFRSVEKWESINPHLLFYSFLPPLIFSEAMKLNVRLVQKCSAQVFLLACPGVLMGTGLVALVAKFLLPYDWSWPVSLTFGAVLSATDPVAVVALFSTLGVSPKLTMLVSGESLMNDGTAIVVFVLMLKVVLGASLDAKSVLTFFGHMTLTSVGFGVLTGLGAVAILGKCAEERFHNDCLVQIITTLCCSYLAFFVAESELATSGVLATVSSGFVVAYFAWPRFVSVEALEAVWEAVEFVGNTVIFFLAGLLFADTLLDSVGIVQLADFGWLLVLYIALLLIRAAMLGVLWVPLNMVGSPIDWREGVAMVWSGLRGAVSLTLAIIIDEEPAISKEMGARIMFHVGGIAALTLLVNATTAAPLLRALGLARSSGAEERKLAALSRHLAEHSQHQFQEGSKDTDLRLAGADEAMLRAMVPSLSTSKEASEDAAGSETAQAYRAAFLQVVKSHYWSSIQQGLLPRTSQSARFLLSSVDVALDSTAMPLADWEAIKSSLEAGRGLLAKLTGEHAMGELLQKAYCVLSFLEAHRSAREELPRFFHDSAQVKETVAAESMDECKDAQQMLQALPDDLVTLARTEMLARKLLQQQLHEVEELKERGLLTSADASKLGHHVQSELLNVLHRPKNEWLALKAGASDK